LDLPTATVEILAGGSSERNYKAKFEAWIDTETNVAHVIATAGPAANGSAFSATAKLTALHPTDRPWGVSNPVRCSGAAIPYPPDVLLDESATGSQWIGIYHRNSANSTLLNSVLDEQGLGRLRGTPADPRRQGVQLANRTFGFAVGGAGFSRQASRDTGNSSVLTTSTGPRLDAAWHVAAAALTSDELTASEWTARVRELLLSDSRGGDIWQPGGRGRARTTNYWRSFWDRSHITIMRAPMPVSAMPSASPEATGFAVSQRYALARYTHAVQSRPGNSSALSMPIKFNGMAFTAQRPDGNATAMCNLAYDGCIESRQWGAYNYWQNLRLPYWPMIVAGDWDTLRTVFEYYLKMLPMAEARTAAYFQHRGIFFCETKTLFGTFAADDYGCDHIQPSSPGSIIRPTQLMDSTYMKFDYAGNGGGPEVCLMILDDYLWSTDAAALTRYLPICVQTVAFFMDHYPVVPGQKVRIFPSQALESYQCGMRQANQSTPFVDLSTKINLTWADGRWHGGLNESNCVRDDAPSVAALTALTRKLLALPVEFTTTAQRAEWRAYAAALPELPRSPDHSSLTAYGNINTYPLEATNSETPQCYAVHPYRLFTAGAARTTNVNLSTAMKGCAPGQPGYGQNGGWAQDVMNDALLGRALEASALVIDRAMHSGCETPAGGKILGWYQRCNASQQQAAPGYRFKGFGYGQLAGHPPAVEELSNMQTALNFMLLQPGDDGFESGSVVLFPAWPCNWDVDFKLAAPLNTTVSVWYAGGKLTRLAVEPPSRTHAVVFANCVVTTDGTYV
jgi:hypothetical protein